MVLFYLNWATMFWQSCTNSLVSGNI
jgi:hypothetical protein